MIIAVAKFILLVNGPERCNKQLEIVVKIIFLLHLPASRVSANKYILVLRGNSHPAFAVISPGWG